jgi:hypothetical protein
LLAVALLTIDFAGLFLVIIVICIAFLQLNEEDFLALWWAVLRGNADGLTSFWSGNANKKAFLEALASRRESAGTTSTVV